MAISLLNNIAALEAQNQLQVTQSKLQNTLFQLSSGSRINSGADDAAGLAIANGMQANMSALTQSQANANNGVGMLQVADGALAQVTTLLNRAITLATESANGTLNGDNGTQRTALDAEYAQIKAEISSIGANTTFNGTVIFQGGAAQNTLQTSAQTWTPDQSLAGDTIAIDAGGKQVASWVAGTTTAGSTVGDFMNYINNLGVGLQANLSSGTSGNLVITDQQDRGDIAVDSTSSAAFQSGGATPLAAPVTTAPNLNELTFATNYGAATPAGANAVVDATAAHGAEVLKLDVGGKTYSYNITPGAAGTGTTVGALMNQINSGLDQSATPQATNLRASLQNGKLTIQDLGSNNDITVDSGTTPVLLTATGLASNPTTTVTPGPGFSVFLSDSTVAGTNTINMSVSSLAANNISGVDLTQYNLATQAGAQSALQQINTAISNIAAMRGNIGAGINRLQAASNVEGVQVQNLTAAQDQIMAANIPQQVTNLSEYSILNQSGISALAQANSAQQSILKLLQ